MATVLNRAVLENAVFIKNFKLLRIKSTHITDKKTRKPSYPQIILLKVTKINSHVYKTRQ